MRHPSSLRTTQVGLSLIELMISLVLGLIIIGGVISVFLGNITAYRTSENLARIQESARTAFELMAREVREAGGNPCGTPLVSNVLNNASSSWWSDWDGGPIQGFSDSEDSAYSSFKPFGTGNGDRVNGTEAFIVRSGTLNDSVQIAKHNKNAANFKVNLKDHGIQADDIVMVCDQRTAAILQVSNANANNVTIVYNTGKGSPGNCSKGLGYPADCSSTNGNVKTFDDGGFIAQLTASYWYIGHNPRGGRSLYRSSVSGNPSMSTVEIAEGIYDMEVRYLETGGNDYVLAASVSDWADVIAIRIKLDLESLDITGTDGATLKREMIHVIGLRNQEYING